MAMVFIFILMLVGISCLPFFMKGIVSKSKPVNAKIRLAVNILSIASIILLFCSLIMVQYNYYFSGYKTTTFILTSSVLLLIFNYLTTKYKNKWRARLNEIILFLFIFVSSLILCISFMGYKSSFFYSDKNYSLEKYTFIKALSGQLPCLYVKEGILEKKHLLHYQENDKELIYENSMENDLIHNYEIFETDSNYRVIFTFNDKSEIITETNGK